VMGSGLPDVWWFRPDGRRMTQHDWTNPDIRVLGVFLNGKELQTRDRHGHPVHDDDFVLLFNANGEGLDFTLPPRRFGRRWRLVLDTSAPEKDAAVFPARGLVSMQPHSVAVLQAIL
jgi:isoamylase